jgi:hypothetical protein
MNEKKNNKRIYKINRVIRDYILVSTNAALSVKDSKDDYFSEKFSKKSWSQFF